MNQHYVLWVMPPIRPSQTADLQRLLCESPRTVTQVLEMLTGEPIRADVVRQCPIVAGDENALGVSIGHPLIQRIAVLRGGASAAGVRLRGIKLRTGPAARDRPTPIGPTAIGRYE